MQNHIRQNHLTNRRMVCKKGGICWVKGLGKVGCRLQICVGAGSEDEVRFYECSEFCYMGEGGES